MKNKEALIVSRDVLNAVIEGKDMDKKFAETIRENFKNDIYVLKNISNVIWNRRL